MQPGGHWFSDLRGTAEGAREMLGRARQQATEQHAAGGGRGPRTPDWAVVVGRASGVGGRGAPTGAKDEL